MSHIMQVGETLQSDWTMVGKQNVLRCRARVHLSGHTKYHHESISPTSSFATPEGHYRVIQRIAVLFANELVGVMGQLMYLIMQST